MKITFLGTGAADWTPNDRERADYRGRTSLLLNNHTLIDIGGCFDYVDRTGKSNLLKEVNTVLITHSHDDHYTKEALERLCSENHHTIDLYGDKSLAEQLPNCANLVFHPLDARFMPTFSIPDFTVTALRANHATPNRAEQPQHYYLENGKTRLFIGFDGGWLMADTWEFLQQHPIDVYLMDATGGENETYDFRNFSHNNAIMRDYLRETCRVWKVLHTDSTVILTHIARTLNPDHATLSARNAEKGYVTAYDGLEYFFD